MCVPFVRLGLLASTRGGPRLAIGSLTFVLFCLVILACRMGSPTSNLTRAEASRYADNFGTRVSLATVMYS
jgi:hypothetical protein